MTATLTKPARKTKAKKATKPARKPAKVGKIPKKAPAESMSQIDAACKWLAQQKQPKTAAEIVAGCAERGYWKSPEGKSPERTLATNILREFDKPTPRIQKTGRGLFAITG